LRHRLYRNLRRVLSDVYGQEIEIEFALSKRNAEPPVTHVNSHNDMPLFQYMSQQPVMQQPETPLHQQIQRPRLNPLPESDINPHLTFDRFIVNKANHMVYEAAKAVAESPDGAYNPLMIHGGVGLGKTHLLQAIANACANRNLNVIYIPSEVFTNELVQAIRDKRQAMFREKYRRADVLIVDDVQFISGKESTQEEFFHTFNALYMFNKQIVLASDRPPDQLVTLEDRLRSRFAGGLLVDLQPPEFETRIAIMEMWAQERGVYIERRVLEVVAERAPDNIRELNGMFNHVVAKTAFSTNKVMDVPRVERTITRYEEPRHHLTRVDIHEVMRLVAEEFGLHADDLTSKRRTKRVSEARQVAMYLARELTDWSLPQIGDHFGGRSHSTVHHSCAKVVEDMEISQSFSELVERLRARLLGNEAHS
jgi:chromosomal replication initiator protein